MLGTHIGLDSGDHALHELDVGPSLLILSCPLVYDNHIVHSGPDLRRFGTVFIAELGLEFRLFRMIFSKPRESLL